MRIFACGHYTDLKIPRRLRLWSFHMRQCHTHAATKYERLVVSRFIWLGARSEKKRQMTLVPKHGAHLLHLRRGWLRRPISTTHAARHTLWLRCITLCCVETAHLLLLLPHFRRVRLKTSLAPLQMRQVNPQAK